MRNAKDWWKLLIVPLVLGAVGQGRPAAADDGLILRGQGQESLIDAAASGMAMPAGEIVTYGTPPRQRWYFRADGLGLKRDASRDRPFAGLPSGEEIFVDVTITGAERVAEDAEDAVQVLDDGDPVVAEDGEDVFVRVDYEATADEVPRSVTTVLGTQDLHFEFEGGYRFTLGRMLSDQYWLEFTYFDVHDWFGTAAVRDRTEYIERDAEGEPTGTTYPASLFSPFTDFGNPDFPEAIRERFDYNHFVRIESTSTLDNMEMNLWHRLATPPEQLEASFLVGLRYMSILEYFRYHSESDVPGVGTTNFVDTRTGNHLFGAQLGALLTFPIEPSWSIDWELKGAVCGNRAHENTRYTPDGVPGPLIGRREGRTTFVGETSVMLVYEFTPRLTVHAGYQALWVDGLALASENVPRDAYILIEGPGQLVHSGNIVYHGPQLGLNLVW